MSSPKKKNCIKQKKESCTGKCSWVPKKGCRSRMTDMNQVMQKLEDRYSAYRSSKLSKDALQLLSSLHLYDAEFKKDLQIFELLAKLDELAKYAKKKIIRKSDVEFAFLFCVPASNYKERD